MERVGIILAVTASGAGFGLAAALAVLRLHGLDRPARLLWLSLLDGGVNLTPFLVILSTIGVVAWDRESLDVLTGALLALLIGTALAANVRWFLLVLKQRVTPFDTVSLPELPASRPGEKVFDVFLSYKAENSTLARRVADWLLANGLRPWLDEYCILISSRHNFADAIRAGLANSRTALVFLDAAYAEAFGTLLELRGLLEHCEADRILPIDMGGPAPSWQEPELGERLAACPFRTNVGDLSQVCHWLKDRFKDRVIAVPPPVEGPMRPIYFTDSAGLKLNVAGWRMEAHRGEQFDFGNLGPVWSRTVAGGRRVLCNLIVGRVAETQRRVLDDGQIRDKRQMQNLLLELARVHLTRLRGDCKGVHLFFLDAYANIPQFAVTYWYTDHWQRLYSVVLPEFPTQEFVFQFALASSFSEFCRHAFLADGLVGSLVGPNAVGQGGRENG